MSAARGKGAGRAAASRGARGGRCWLVKTEPESYSIADLQRDGVTGWDGVRNYQARNTLRDDMAVGDRVLVYHSSADPPAVVGLAEVAGAGRPDPTAFDPKDHHYDPKSRREEPTWFLVDLKYVETFREPLSREALARIPELRGMVLLQRGSRLSVQPVAPAEFDRIVALARAAGPPAAGGSASRHSASRHSASGHSAAGRSAAGRSAAGRSAAKRGPRRRGAP